MAIDQKNGGCIKLYVDHIEFCSVIPLEKSSIVWMPDVNSLNYLKPQLYISRPGTHEGAKPATSHAVVFLCPQPKHLTWSLHFVSPTPNVRWGAWNWYREYVWDIKAVSDAKCRRYDIKVAELKQIYVIFHAIVLKLSNGLWHLKCT